MKPLTYPARPVQGGPLDKARAKSPGTWYYEPKYNGWRALVHVPTGTMFNRKGEQLSIAAEFATALDHLKASKAEWLDCEALDRRHGLGRGSLVVLDEPGCPLPFERRLDRLVDLMLPVGAFVLEGLLGPSQPRSVALLGLLGQYTGPDSIAEIRTMRPTADSLLLPSVFTQRQADHVWRNGLLQAVNGVHQLNCDFYEGLVAKRGDSLYPIQLRSPDEAFGGWIKHRWQW